MRCADSCVGASEDDDVLHGLRCEIWIFYSVEVVDGEEVKREVYGLLKTAYGLDEDINHSDCGDGVLGWNKYSM